jgi:hypothetical protein
MVDDVLEKQLHDRATRGEALSPEEQAHLATWYAVQDRAELGELHATDPDKTIPVLHAQIDSALAQLTVLTRRIQEIITENGVLRREIAVLHRQLAQHVSPQPA